MVRNAPSREQMPWVRIPPARLPHVTMFGIDFIGDDADANYAWYRGARGRMRVEKANPFIFVDDEADAIQLDGIGIILSGSPHQDSDDDDC